MNTKWYISTLFFLFTLFSAFQEEVATPNQEIVIQFADTKISKKNIETTLAHITNKLQNVGASNITIKKTKKGNLKISYFSAIDSDEVKSSLKEQVNVSIEKNNNESPTKENTLHYNLDVYELKNATDFKGLNDNNIVFKIKQQSDRFTNYNSFILFRKATKHKATLAYKIAFKNSKVNAFYKDSKSYKEPVVRAGPNNLFI